MAREAQPPAGTLPRASVEGGVRQTRSTVASSSDAAGAHEITASTPGTSHRMAAPHTTNVFRVKTRAIFTLVARLASVPLTNIIKVLGKRSVLSGLDEHAIEQFTSYLTPVEVPVGSVVVREGERGNEIFFILDGQAEVSRNRLVVQTLGAGSEFGSLGMLTGRARAATVTANTHLVLARLGPEDWATLKMTDPALAMRVVEALFLQARENLTHVTDIVGTLLKGRSLPRTGEVSVRMPSGERVVPTGTQVRSLLPHEVSGHLVVAGLLNHKPVSLTTPVVSDTTLAPLTLEHWEGRQIYARSLALLLLEAAHDVDPLLDVQLGPSLGTYQLVEVDAPADALPALAAKLRASMLSLAEQTLHIRQEYWTVDEATDYFTSRGWDAAAKLLKTHRGATIPLVSCGRVYALSLGPMLPHTADLTGFHLEPTQGGLALDLGARDPRRRFVTEPAPEGTMVGEHRAWMKGMGVTSVGAFNELCVNGKVAQLIRVSEGFHEKQISHIADSIAAAKDRLRIICIAGPSSSGKTTFIKRLSVQLHIDGLTPINLSLDDYYVDRDKTPKDESGEWDFEALEAINLGQLQADVRRLLDGEEVTLSRYDFKEGRSHAGGGHTLQLRPGDVLLLEGIHGLNPKLLGDIPGPGQLFRVFVHPATSLPYDRLSRVSPTDLRLLRRIVRDRHTRGYSAAENIARWPSVQTGERRHIFPYQRQAHAVFDSSLVYEPAVLKVFAERYLLEVPPSHPSFATAWRLRHLVDRFVAIYPDHVPPTSIIREFIGGSGFEY